MNIRKLKEQTLKANLGLVEHSLVIFTWGNVSMIDRTNKIVAIKPSGVSYDSMCIDDIVVVDFDGNIIEGDMQPSSDLPTHLELYKAFKDIGGIVHTHSTFSTIFAQAGLAIPCLGTTHADYFYGGIPITRKLKHLEIKNDYEKNTGKVIIEAFKNKKAYEIPGVLVMNHGPFIWGKDAQDALHNAAVMEQLAETAYATMLLAPKISAIDDVLLDKHYLRKHGKNAYYGQK